MIKEIAVIKSKFFTDLKNAVNLKDIETAKHQYLGKNGHIKLLFSNNKNLECLKELNALLKDTHSALAIAAKKLKDLEQEDKLIQQKIDITYPARPQYYGVSNLINEAIENSKHILEMMGFEYITGPEMESEYNVFDALNIPKYHPARQTQDTFYLNNGSILRTHTSSVQIREMKIRKPPFCIFSIGRVYRKDWDATHTPMFHQIEGLCVDENVNMCNMKYCLITFLQNFFQDEIQTRIRPSYFPFTEPSAEIDIKQKSDNWLEVLGCGMVHQNVFKNLKIDNDKFQGFAFGIGVERIAMLKNNIKDLRSFFDNDLR